MLKSWMTRAVLGRTSVSNAVQPAEKPDASFEGSWRRVFKARLIVMLAVILGWAAVLEARLVYLQVISHADFVAEAKDQHEDEITLEAGRGEIFDRNGEILAISVESFRVIADPSVVTVPEQEAAEICAALGDCTKEERVQLVKRLSNTAARYAMVRPARAVSPQSAVRLQELIARRIADKKPPVLTLVPEMRRYYPKRQLAGQVLGAVGFDGEGVSGIEDRWNKEIAGANGLVRVFVDAGRKEIGSIVERPATAGASVELTLDARLQHIAERELNAAVREYQAAGGSVVIMQPFTGEILAQANSLEFNPNTNGAYSDSHRVNATVQNTYEPGSTFKIVTASGALNDRVVKPSDLIDTNPGYVKLPGRTPIREAHGRNHGVLSFEESLIKSSNVAAIHIGNRLGSERLRHYIHGFGFGRKLGPDFIGESRGRVPSGLLSESSRASISMGYEIGVTPLQVAAAASVIANGGLLMEPRVLRATVRDGVRTEIAPKVIHRIISEETAATMTAIMEGVASRGTAKAAALTRYRVAGKTGTAKKVVNGRYSETEYNVSFVGFVPSNKPAFTILVVIDTPRKGEAYGGTIAAPVFKRIAEAALQQVGVAPSIYPAPPIISASTQPAPTAPAASPEAPVITRVGGRPVMPDLRGLSLREAMRLTNSLGLFVATQGDGTVVAQTPAAGEFVDPGQSGSLQLQRQPVAPRGGR